MDGFKDKYSLIFDVVAQLLGNGWRINKLESACDYRIKLTSPNFKYFAIIARMDKGRIYISGGIIHHLFKGEWLHCTVSPHRQPIAIATDIERKILPTALTQVESAMREIKKHSDKKAEREIVISSIGRVMKLSHSHYCLCGFQHNEIIGSVKETYGGYFDLNISRLTKEKLLYVTGFLSTL
ncbi:hypothetical protein AW19_4142 (plasmid) [Yersinia frederiksenii Y225]|nr:hypothetical protein AW19_4142 [Yersinia frederiksenii Y225]